MAMKGSLSSYEHEVATSYALPMCSDCNKGRGGAMYATEALLHYYARAYHEANREVMMRTLQQRFFDIMALNERALRQGQIDRMG